VEIQRNFKYLVTVLLGTTMMETEPDITTAASGIANKSLEVELQHPLLKKSLNHNMEIV
jgi:hypothetical protein